MRFIVMVKATPETEKGVLPTEQELAEMGKFNDELVKAGVMLAGEGLHASSKGSRISYSGGKRTVRDGPFTEAKELVAGFWIWQVKNKAEALEWAKRIPFQEGEVEIRQVFEEEDFGKEFTPELREQERRQRVAIEKNKQRSGK
ncbi:MAG TPA: YciI family protein [Gemmatimonadales bacterium]|nr:YciI family protein [Gemmatimonadales bacterium]